ncbi:MAG: hypothetical protein M1839_004512 [Geoglossum umbratile]|nr:MAG: hypothetical protein M1839_004512 [Geoglossum umbratile]
MFIVPTLRERPVDSVKLMADTGGLLESVNALTLEAFERDSPGELLTDYEFLSSFNWVERDTPAIFVPGNRLTNSEFYVAKTSVAHKLLGCPPAWAPKDFPYRIPKDEGTFFVDQNTARCPEYPAEALFRSLAIMRPDFSMRDVDLVTDRNCLRKLLRFASGSTDRSFRIDISIVCGTMIFRRWEEETRQTILGSQHIGYGHNFESESTTFDPNLRESCGHHRVVRYRLGGLHCVLRFEADGYFSDSEGAPSTNEGESGEKFADDVDLLDKLQTLSLSHDDKPGPRAVEVIHRGRTVPLPSLIEIKTRSIKKVLNLSDITPQLWFSQTPYLYVAYHNAGMFMKLDKHTTSAEFVRWEDQHQKQLLKLIGLIKKLKDIAEGVEGKRCIVVCDSENDALNLKVYESGRKGAVLSEEVMGLHKWS